MIDESAVPVPRRASTLARLTALFVGLALVLAAVDLHVWRTTERFVGNSELVARGHDVEIQTSALLARLATVQADAIGYAAGGDSLLLARFSGQLPLLDSEARRLIELVAGDPAQARRARELAKTVEQQRDAAAALVEERRRSGRVPDSFAAINMNAVRGMSRFLLDEEDDRVAQQRVDVAHTSQLAQTMTAVAIALSLVFLGIAYALVAASLLRGARTTRELRSSNTQLAEALGETSRARESMHKLGQLGEMLQSCRRIDEVRGGIGGIMTDLLPGLGGRLALINPSQNLAAIGAHWGRHALIAESIFEPEDCWALRRGQAYPLAGTNAGFVCRHVHWPAPDQPEAGYLCVPLLAQGEVIGVLTLDGERAPTAAERRIALAAGEQLALAFANLRLQETLRTQSIRDPLTGLFNRRYLEASLERELLRAERRNLPLSLLMLDVDHFKRFNDSHGHEAGDALLAKFAEAVLRSVRSEDIVCRYGGEEFTVLLLEADAGVATRCAEAIRSAVAGMGVAHRQVQLPHVTVSIGCAVHPGDGRGAEALMRRADAALYAAKDAGRNRVMLASALAADPAPA